MRMLSPCRPSSYVRLTVPALAWSAIYLCFLFYRDMSVQNLRYLSSEQALADLASFRQAMQKKFHLTSSNKWISFGGSYPGALSAWFRLKYPHLVAGAWKMRCCIYAVCRLRYCRICSHFYFNSNPDAKLANACSELVFCFFNCRIYCIQCSYTSSGWFSAVLWCRCFIACHNWTKLQWKCGISYQNACHFDWNKCRIGKSVQSIQVRDANKSSFAN